ncbi:MAG: hypothetical protein EOP50_04750 [Sphingobacteriales bacterium]|nr:MAG: hypothetical protein EOP50_04750 [Sphingobacteriales bacterium]
MAPQHSPTSDIDRLQRNARRPPVLTAVLLVVAVVMAFVVLWKWLSLPNTFPDVAQQQMPLRKHRIDLLLMDAPDLSPGDMQWMLRPLIMVADTLEPGKSQHFKIIVHPSGMPQPYAGSGIGAAGYVAEENLILVDVAAVRTMVAGASDPQRWAFVMAHEATHQWQNRAGALKGRRSTFHDSAAYGRDPVEIEAYRIGLAVANAVPGDAFYWIDAHGTSHFAPQPNPYLALAGLSVQQRAEVFIQAQTTPRRALHLAKDLVLSSWRA